MKLLKSVIATDSRQPLAHMYLGQVLFERGQPAEAEKAFKASLAVDPTFGAPHFYLGQLYESQDHKREALREYREAVARQADLTAASDAAKRLEAQVAADVPTQGNARPGR
jgi:predicted Zn-dependent protease